MLQTWTVLHLQVIKLYLLKIKLWDLGIIALYKYAQCMFGKKVASLNATLALLTAGHGIGSRATLNALMKYAACALELQMQNGKDVQYLKFC